ncbi:YdjN1 [Bacillus atrophaeus UCMB-5137]|nr:YdjN1 [Bacillus atrophaeus UCMB-5137]
MKNKKMWVTLFIMGLVSILILFSNVYNSNTSHVTSKISDPDLLMHTSLLPITSMIISSIKKK